jgi:hypothetical protein
MINYNTEFLIKVKVNDFYPSNWYTYRTERKIIGLVTRKAGIYREVFEDYFGDEVPENHTLKDGVVYENPKCVLCYADGSEKTYYFDNKSDAVEFGAKFTVDDKWVN